MQNTLEATKKIIWNFKWSRWSMHV